MLENIYKKEYETTPITLNDLHTKYSIEQGSINTQHWVKTPTIISSKERTLSTQPDKTLQQKVDKAKMLIMDNALTILATEINEISIKEFKDVVSIVDTLDDNKRDEEKTTVTIAIQNIIGSYKDDC